ncbi:uncharacterized protein LOC142530464 [Primulina tabacum]|uniref:uncharacterized protein LOC142530464 n=1 Tax=Primulina tabacum TaxID=48773 RepID=UPI003F5AB42E
MVIALRAKNKLAFIDASCSRPAPGANTILQWEHCNAIVLSWLMNSVSKEIFGGIVYSTDAVAVWEDLRERFDKVNGSRIFTLHQGDRTISASGKEYVEYIQQHKLLQFLMGLNDSYVHIRSQILMMTPLPTVAQAFAIISQEESHRSILSPMSSQSVIPSSVFFSAQDKRRGNIRCEHCNMLGHNKEVCFKLVGYPPGHRLYRGPNRGINQKYNRDWYDKGKPMGRANVSVTPQAMVDQVDIPSNTGSFFTPAQYAAILKMLEKDQPAEELGVASANMADNSSSFGSSWIIDTGANDHMVGHHTMLRNSLPYADAMGSIQLPNGHTTKVTHVGPVDINNTITLDHVLFVPDFQHNLFLSTLDLPFPFKGSFESTHTFQLLHLDIWGPYNTPTYNGERYFLTIVDDFSRATWVYLLHSKLDVFPTFKAFLLLIQNQFSASVKFIRTDNGTEFFQAECTTLLNSLGIIHQSSCPYTPQQNGLVERKHRHILEAARALKLQASLPHKYWGDCVLTAVYLINRTPTLLLGNHSPYEALFHCTPSYSHLRVLGCLVYASVLPRGDKFAPRATACVFLGYSSTQK